MWNYPIMRFRKLAFVEINPLAIHGSRIASFFKRNRMETALTEGTTFVLLAGTLWSNLNFVPGSIVSCPSVLPSVINVEFLENLF